MLERVATRALAAALCLTLPAAISGPSMAEERILYSETPDDPPGDVRARDDLLARSPGARVAQGPYVSIQVNVDNLGQNIVGDAANEPSITINPKNPNNIVIAWRQFDTINSNFRQAGWGYSFDAGLSWTFPGVLDPGQFRSDPVLDADSQGNLYYQSLTSAFELDLFKSDDGSVTWGTPVDAFGGDKNWLAIDRTGGQGEGNVYEIWQRFAGCCGLEAFSRSVDAAASFETPIQIAGWPTFGTMTVGPDGEIYAAGIDGTFSQDLGSFIVSKSTDAMDPAVVPTFTSSSPFMNGEMVVGAGPNPAGLLGQVNIATDHSDGPTRGNIYLLASVDPNSGPDPLDVHFMRSTDGGTFWGLPTRVNNDPAGSDVWNWMAALSVAPDGRLDAVWNDTRNGSSFAESELFYAYSYDAGDTWMGNVPVSPPFNSFQGFPNQNKIGDYYTMISDTTGAGVAYSATFNGEQDVYYLRVFPDCNDNALSDVIDLDQNSSADCNVNRIPDECESSVNCVVAGAIPSESGGAEPPLTLDRLPGGQIRLAWSPSCLPGNSRYGVYEGTLGDFTSHSPRACSVTHFTFDFTPASNDTFYLVVPNTGSYEGSYGKDSQDNQRPQANPSCRPQAIADCA